MIRDDIEPAHFQNHYNVAINLSGEEYESTDIDTLAKRENTRMVFIKDIVGVVSKHFEDKNNLYQFKEYSHNKSILNECDLLDIDDDKLIAIIMDNLGLYDGGTSYDEHRPHDAIYTSFKHPTYPNGREEHEARVKKFEPIKSYEAKIKRRKEVEHDIVYHSEKLDYYTKKLSEILNESKNDTSYW